MTTPRVKHPRRSRIHPYVNSTLRHQLDEYATKHGLTESAVIQEALLKHFKGIGDKEVLYGRLNHVSSAIDRAGEEVAELRADICELRQHVLAQGQLLQMLVPTFLSLGQLLPADKRPGKAPGLPAAVRNLYQAVAQRVAQDRTLLNDLPAEVRERLKDKVTEKRWSVQPALDDHTPREASSDVQQPPAAGADAPDDVWLDTEPDDDHG